MTGFREILPPGNLFTNYVSPSFLNTLRGENYLLDK